MTTYHCDRCGKHAKELEQIGHDYDILGEICEECLKALKKWLKETRPL